MVLSHLALTSEGSKCAYHRVVICTAMTEEPFYAYLKETLKDKCKLYSPGELPDVDQLVPGQPKKGEHIFLILDDLIADLEKTMSCGAGSPGTPFSVAKSTSPWSSSVRTSMPCPSPSVTR
jgi:hypothetical protein